MTDSILNTTKKVLGIEATYDVFDVDIMLHINSVFSTLQQLGVGPVDGFMITDDSAKWADFIGDTKNINMVKTYMILRVRLLFDPPTTSFAIDSFKKQAEELEWRLNVAVDRSVGVPYYEGGYWWVVDDDESLPRKMAEGDLGFDPETGNVWRKS